MIAKWRNPNPSSVKRSPITALLKSLAAAGWGWCIKAEDTRLKRLVALKFLPEGVAHDTVCSDDSNARRRQRRR